MLRKQVLEKLISYIGEKYDEEKIIEKLMELPDLNNRKRKIKFEKTDIFTILRIDEIDAIYLIYVDKEDYLVIDVKIHIFKMLADDVCEQSEIKFGTLGVGRAFHPNSKKTNICNEILKLKGTAYNTENIKNIFRKNELNIAQIEIVNENNLSVFTLHEYNICFKITILANMITDIKIVLM